jgi:hypothetical protein
MARTKYLKALNAYTGLMEEAKYRLLATDIALGGATGLPDGAIREYCFLQLRMLCELIALGCLTAHGDLATGKLKGNYEADRIIRGLQPLHRHFYPIAATLTEEPRSIRLHEDGFLTKEELQKLYRRCHDVLHRGSFKAQPSKGYSDADIEEIRTWKKKIEAFRCHAIYMADNRTMAVFWFKDGRTWWGTFEGDQIAHLGQLP